MDQDEILNRDPADPNAPVTARITYLEEWIRDCQRYNRNVSAQHVAALDDAHNQRLLVAQKDVEIRQLRAQLRALAEGKNA